MIPLRRAAVVAAVALPELALGVAWAFGMALFAVVLAQLVVLLSYGIAAGVAAWLAARQAYLRSVHESATMAERGRLAAEMHDLLGHRLALLALKAGALQLQTEGAAQQTATELRSGVESAIAELADTIAVLGEEHQPGPPAATELSALLATARAAGMMIAVDDEAGQQVAAGIHQVAISVVREALTNAARHAPGQPVTLRTAVRDGTLEVRVDNPTVNSPRTPGAGTGLATLRRRLQAYGGDLVHGVDGYDFSLAATLPVTPPAPIARAATALPSPTALFVRKAWLPILITTVVVLGFQLWAGTGATLEPDQFAAIRSGQTVPNLPPRQAPVRLLPTPRPPANATCRQYTDGNFPLAYATFQVCVTGTVVTSTTDLRSQPPW